MPTIRERIGYALAGDRFKDELQTAVRTLTEAYAQGPYLLPPEELMGQLSEYMDSGLIWDLVRNAQYDVIGGLSGDFALESEQARLRAVDESRRAYKVDVVTQWIIHLWTDFGFGENIVVTPNDEAARDKMDDDGNVTAPGVWSKFWESDKNRPVLADDELHYLSETVLKDGEEFLAYFVATVDGETTVRRIDTKQITEIITDPEDDQVKWFYKRQWNDKAGAAHTTYYPDWRIVVSGEIDRIDVDSVLPRDAKVADRQSRNSSSNGAVTLGTDERPTTRVLMQHIAHNRKGDHRGWPLMTTGLPWVRAHKQFRENRSAVAAAVAMYVNKLKVQGGSRAIDSVKARIQSALSQSQAYETNPSAAPGSTWLENQAANLERLPLGTGASDAKNDGEALLLMAGLGGGLFPHWLGAGDSYRLATATSMEAPLLRQFSRYQKFWGAQFRKMVRIVLWAAKEYGKKKITDFGADVSTDRLVETDLQQIATSLNALVRDTLIPMVDGGLMPPEVAKKITARIWLAALQALGVEDANEIATDEAFNPPVEPVEEPSGSDNGQVQEAVDPETGKFMPRGYPMPAWGDGDAPITSEDVEQAVRQWNNAMPRDFWDMLRATPATDGNEGSQ